MTHSHQLMFACVGAIVGLGSSVATAQVATGVETITVTARRTDEKLQDVPLQVSAYTADMLKQVNVATIRDINNLTPSMNFQGASFGRAGGAPRLFFRGLGASASGNQSKANSFMDGIYLAGGILNIPYDYLERVESMPGPQSAQFGRATFGGALNFVTKDPTETYQAKVNFDVATGHQQNFNAMVSGPLAGEKLLGLLFVAYENYGGPSSWTSPPDILHPKGVGVQATNTYMGAAKFIFKPSDDFRIEARLTRNKDHDGPSMFYWTPLAEKNGVFINPLTGATVRYPVGVVKAPDTVNPTINQFPNFDTIPDPTVHTEHTRASLEANWHIAEHDLTFNYGHEYESVKRGWDTDFGPFPASYTLGQKQRTKANQFEIRIASPREQRLRYAFGGYYLKQANPTVSTGYTVLSCVDSCFQTNGFASYFSPVASYNPVTRSIPGWTGTVNRVNTVTPTDNTTEVRDIAGFGAVNFDVIDKVRVNLEGRYQSERVLNKSFLPGGFVGQTTVKTFLPRLTAEYRPAQDVMLYVLYSVGNNPLGFNTSPFIGAAGTGTTAADRIVKEEKLYNYEAGMKATWLEGRLTTNVTVYHMRWKNQSVSQTLLAPDGTTLFSLLRSTGSTTIDGFGLEVQAAPMEGLSVRGILSYNRSVYKDYCSTAAFQLLGRRSPGQLGCAFVNGNRMEAVPPWTASTMIAYQRPINDTWDWFVRGNFAYQQGQWESDLNLAKQESGYIFGLNVGVESEKYSVQVYCSNCTQDTEIYRFVRIFDNRSGTNLADRSTVGGTPRRPRQFGVKGTWSF